MDAETSVISPPDLIPARMLNEYAYCPRLCYLEWVQQEWDENQYTLDGSYKHRRVDRPGGELPDADEFDQETLEEIHARSVMLSAPEAGFIAVCDLIESESGEVIPVDYKRGAIPDNEEQSWEPERVQLAAQALILRENGYDCRQGVIYYCQSRHRITISIDDELIQRTMKLAEELRDMAKKGEIPPHLVDSPKCPHCSLVGICLPDETSYVFDHGNESAQEDDVRRLYPARDDEVPLYVQEQGAFVGKKGEELVVKKKGELLNSVRLMELSHLCLYGSVQISTQMVQELLKRSIPILYYSYGGWFHGICTGMSHKNVELRRLQFAAAERGQAIEIARTLVRNKIQNCRTMLRRNGQNGATEAAEELKRAENQSGHIKSLETLLGIEGNAGRIYFEHFSSMIKPKENNGESMAAFDFQTRNRRPPRDPINALLSFAYSLLTKDFTITLLAVGFDPYLGFYHQPRYGRPALAWDLMEPFRPLIADSTVLNAVNNGIIQANDFIRSAGAVALKPEARKRFILAYERRMDSLVTHPIFNYRVSYRRIMEIQARLLSRYLTGELKQVPEFVTR
ncbi:MAG: CRISPR-associated endonuclease Cas4g/Cas1g [Candidatus Hinthialibacter sp.]